MKHIFSFKNTLLLSLLILSLIAYRVIAPSSFIQAISPNIVISEVQIAGTVANDEFVELYNPTNQVIDLTGWRLSRRSASASASLTTLVSSISGSIQPQGYFLIANPSFTNNTVSVDLLYSATSSGIASNNTVILFSDNGQTVVDKVAMGTAQDRETTSTVVPETGQSIERKANENATAISMITGGIDELLGNGYDSDNNLNDFIVRAIPQPQNSLSNKEPIIVTSPTPTDTPTPTNTPAPTETPTPSPTVLPSPTLTGTPMPTVTPTATPTTVPTSSPTATPTQTPSPTPLPTTIPTPTVLPTPTVSISPTPTPRVIEYQFPNSTLVCTWGTRRIELKFMTIVLPTLRCVMTR